MEFRHGDSVAPLKETGDAPMRENGLPLSGTEVTFMPSLETFAFIDFDLKTLEHRLRELAFLNSGVTIWLRDLPWARSPPRRSCTTRAASKPSCATWTRPRRHC